MSAIRGQLPPIAASAALVQPFLNERGFRAYFLAAQSSQLGSTIESVAIGWHLIVWSMETIANTNPVARMPLGDQRSDGLEHAAHTEKRVQRFYDSKACGPEQRASTV
ncbi:MAG: hypothetical protein JOZ28_00995 [Candidatus Eremiobacteraeota bacterium]|nr:hypothetical protein [Candidatus Eremiobacteraeota bacterium]